MRHTKAAFKAMREMVGMSQPELAKALDVSERSVRRWESPKMEYWPFDDAWAYLENALAVQQNMVADTLSLVDEVIDITGHEPESVPVTYYLSQSDYDEHGRDKGSFALANANARAVATALMAEGIEVEFRYTMGEPAPIRTPGSRY